MLSLGVEWHVDFYPMKRNLFIVGKALLVITLMSLTSCHKNLTIVWTSNQDSLTVAKPTLKVYVESSGSMNGYMCDGAELKDAIYSYVSALDSYSDTLYLSYINSEIVPSNEDLRAFIRDLTVSKFKSIAGNKANSDIAEMLDMILKCHQENDVSVFVSDFILDVPQGNAQDFLVNRQIDIRNTFVKKLGEDQDLGVEIFRLESKFDGMYYSSYGNTALSKVKRPYYMWVIGNKHILADLNKKVPFTEIKHGLKNYFAYSTFEDVPFKMTNYAGVTSNPLICKNTINDIYRVNLIANLQATLQDSLLLKDKRRYELLSNQIVIDTIVITKNGEYMLCLDINKNIKPVGEYIKYVSEALPTWIDTYHDEEGNDVKMNIDKTVGIKYIISGVSDAYKEKRVLAGMKFAINN